MEKLTSIKEEGLSQTEVCEDLVQLQQLRVLYLGRKGPTQEVIKSMKDLSKEEHLVSGQLVNEAKTPLTNAIGECRATLETTEMEKRIAEGKIDITLSDQRPNLGNACPPMIVQQEMGDLSIGLGYTVEEGPEVEMDLYNLERANIPKDHPARGARDASYINAKGPLHTYTIAIQTRQPEKFAQEGKGLIKVICLGEVYRRDDNDAAHSCQFMQCEGLVVSEYITLPNLKRMLQFLVQKMFGKERVIRSYPSYFQFIEPNVEVSVSRYICGSKSCPVCKGTGWTEILGAGTVHPDALSMTGYDAEKLNGFAFGTGIGRVVMLKYGITDIRNFYTSGIRFLKTFNRLEQKGVDIKTSKKWLDQYMDLFDMSIEGIANKIMSAGPEVEDIEKMSQGNGPVIGKVISCESHPNFDCLYVCQVDLGDEIEQVVHGAPNVTAGQKAVMARVGAKLLGGDIKTDIIRGQESDGVICSLLESGVDPHQLNEKSKNGTEMLDENVPVGDENSLGYLALDDEILDVGLTPNRNDCMIAWSMILETSAILHKEVNTPYVGGAPNVGEASRLTVCSGTEECPPFLGRVINSVTTEPSLGWMRELLIAAGMEPINNVVDTNNIVMLEIGQSLRFHDLDAIPAQKITVKDQQWFDYTVLGGGGHHTEEDDIVITAEGKLIDIVSVMGGNDFKVEEMTKGIVIEAVIPYHVSTRNTSCHLNLGIDASVRYQKSIESIAIPKVVDRAMQLLIEYANVSELEEAKQYSSNSYTPLEFDVNLDHVNVLLSTDSQQEEVMKVPDDLHLEPPVNNSDIYMEIPGYRIDLVVEVGIVEEITRILGHEYLPSTMPKMSSTVGAPNRCQRLHRKCRNMLSDLGHNEAVTHSLVGKKEIGDVVVSCKDIVKLATPMSEDHEYVQDSTSSSLLGCMAYNQMRSIRGVALFGTSNVYGLGCMEKRLAVAVSGVLRGNHWQKFRMGMDFYTVKGLVEALLESVGYQGNRVVFKENHTGIVHLHSHRNTEVHFGRELLGLVGQTHPKMAQAYDITETFAPKINLEVLLENKPGRVKLIEVGKHLPIGRDLASIVKRDVRVADIISNIKRNSKLEKKNIIQNVEAPDVYTGEHVEKGGKSIALSIVFQPAQRILKDADVNEIHNRILETLEKDLHTQSRA